MAKIKKTNPENDNLWALGKKYNILQKKAEFMPFIEYIKSKKAKSILEIGTNAGGTTAIFCAIADKVVSIDKTMHPVSHHLESEFPNFQRIIGDSLTVQVPAGPYDVLLIDGGHELDAVVNDYFRYRDYVRDGGIIAFHDILNDGEFLGATAYIKKLWAILKANLPADKFVEFINTTDPADSGYEPLNNPDDLARWGGIGCLIK